MSEDHQIYHRYKNDDFDQFMNNNVYFPTRTIYMGSVYTTNEGQESGVDHFMAEKMIKALHVLDTKAPNGDKPITIIMNNPGGDEYHGMAIFDAIQNCKNYVSVHVYGHAMSMGSIILLAADERKMSKHSSIMIHYGTFGIHDHSKISYKWTKEGKKFDQKMEKLYLSKMKGRQITQQEYYDLIDSDEKLTPKQAKQKITITSKHLKEMLKYDTFIDAPMAIKLGLVDSIINEDNLTYYTEE